MPVAVIFSSTIWETATILFLVVPLTLLWAGCMVDTVLRKDLLRRQKFLWLIAIFLFPIVGTLIYVLRRPGLRERASSIRDERPLAETRQMTTATLDNFAVTMDLTQSTLKQTSELLDQVVKMLSEAESTAGFVLPLTNIRPLGPVEVRVRRLVNQTRMLRVTMERMSLALGMNAGDLRNLARQIDKLGLAANTEEFGPVGSDLLDVPPEGRSTDPRSAGDRVRTAERAPGSDGNQPTPAV